MHLNRFAVLTFFALVLPMSASAAPVISGATDISIQATDPSGAVVTFSPTATDTIDGTDPVICTPASGSTFPIGDTTVGCDSTNSVPETTTATFVVHVTLQDTIIITLRDNGTLIGPFTITLPDVNAAPVPLSATGDPTSHLVPARSVLAQLVALDASSTDFDITDLKYFSSFNSFIVSCVSVPAASLSPDCFNWTYAVNGSFPFVGMDGTVLHNGDRADIFFGSQWEVSTDKSAVVTGETVTATAQEYDAVQGIYVPASGEIVGAVQFDTNFNAIEFATSTTDSNGQATLSLPNAGSYVVGIAASGYFPNVPLTVSSSTPVTPPTGGGGGGGGSIIPTSFSLTRALSFLTNNQGSDGSFANSPLITDWVAIAFGAADPGPAKTKLKNYLVSATPPMTTITDYERHAMALEAVGINPYSGTPVNYISPIVSAFDGTQIGTTSVNDDIFAIFPLIHAGYTATDPIIQKEIAYIISKQLADGSWDESPDLTAAAIQAVGPFFSAPHYGQSMGAAAAYLLSQSSPTIHNADGGWGILANKPTNIDSTSWVQTAINAIPVDPTHAISWATSGGHVAMDVFLADQELDGAVQPTSASVDTRIWSTAYVIPAASGQSWLTALQSFPLPTFSSANGASLTTGTTATSTTATSTPSVATSTVSVAPPVVPTTTPAPQQIPIKPKAKPIVTIARAASTTASSSVASLSQPAAAAAAPTGGFFSHLWSSVLSFFGKIL